jgi:hypothetical protein
MMLIMQSGAEVSCPQSAVLTFLVVLRTLLAKAFPPRKCAETEQPTYFPAGAAKSRTKDDDEDEEDLDLRILSASGQANRAMLSRP